MNNPRFNTPDETPKDPSGELLQATADALRPLAEVNPGLAANVLSGEIYAFLAKTNDAPRPADPSMVNANRDWIREVITPLGFIVVSVYYPPTPERGAPPIQGNVVGQSLDARGFGHFDSENTAAQVQFFWVRRHLIAPALTFLSEFLNQKVSLPGTKIGYFDPASEVWRTWHE